MNKTSFNDIIPDTSTGIDINMGVFRTRIFRVSELMAMLDSKKLRFVGGKPFKSWSKSHKSRVIESLLLELPPDSVIIDGADSPWFVADGAELLSTIHEYIHDQFQLDSVSFNLDKYYGRSFNDLPLILRSRLLNLNISASIISSEASTIYRLSVYSSALLKIGKEKVLWNCAQEVYAVTFKKLKDLAKELNAYNPQTLLQIIIAIGYADVFITGSFNNKKNSSIGKIRFDMFECIVLETFDQIYPLIKSMFEKDRTFISDLVRFFNDNNGEFITKTGKKSSIFRITTTLLALRSNGYDMSTAIKQFKEAWHNCRGIGKGYLNIDYAIKSSAIYNYLNK